MSDIVDIDEASVDLIQQTIDAVRIAGIMGGTSGLVEEGTTTNYAQRGYLCQSISRGQQGLCSIYTRNPLFRVFKIDLAGIIYTNYPDLESKFKLRFYKEGATWFDTDEIIVDNLSSHILIDAITLAGNFRERYMVADLGHPFKSTDLIQNNDLFPSLPTTFRLGDLIESKMGSWVFGFYTKKLPAEFDIDLLFSVSDSKPVQLNGPAVMTLQEISDCPVNRYIPVTDCLDLASPTPLRGGTKVILNYFDDVGWGIVAANPREYFFEERYTPT